VSKLYTGIGFVVWKALALLGVPYAKKKVEERG
jgi:hypothetical protein